MSGAPACSVIIISYNSGSLLPTCLHSVFRALQGMEHQVIVLDNGSPEPLTAELKLAYPQVEWMFSDTNLGFGKACNKAAEKAKYPYLFFVNPDTLVSSDTFFKVLDYTQKLPNAGIVGCRILNGNGTLQWACRRSFPSPLGAIYKTLGLAWLFPKSKRFGSYNLTYLDPNEAHEVDAVSGSFFCLRQDVYREIGGFDEDFFLYGEDLDICYRVQQAGYHNHYFPGTSIIHFKGQSSRTRLLKSYIDFYRAMLIFARKHPKFLDPVPLWLISFGVFFAAALGIFSRLLPDWLKLFIDIVVFAAVWGICSIASNTGVHFDWFVGVATSIFVPLLISGGYGFGLLSGTLVLRKVVPLSSLVFGGFLVFKSLPPELAFAVLGGFFLTWFWRRLLHWFHYFYGVFTGRRRRSVLLGDHDQIDFWFRKENILAGRDILGCVTRGYQSNKSIHYLGSVQALPKIRSLTGFRELLVIPDKTGWHEDSPTLGELGEDKFDTILLVGHPNTSTFAMVDLNFLK